MITIQILGMGCSRCRVTETNALKAIDALGVEASMERIEDIDTILKYDISATPGVLINGEIIANDRIVGFDEFIELLRKIEKEAVLTYSIDPE